MQIERATLLSPVVLLYPRHWHYDFDAATTADDGSMFVVFQWFSLCVSVFNGFIKYINLKYSHLWSISSLKYQSQLTDSQQSKSNRNTAHRLHLSSSRASVRIFVTKHSKLFCSSNMLRAKFNKIWLRLYSCTDISKSCAFCMPMPQNVKYRRNTSTSRSVNSFGAVFRCENRTKKIQHYIVSFLFGNVQTEH